MNTNLPIVAVLTPSAPPVLADTFEAVDSPITQGLPHVVALGVRFRAVLALPTGHARLWLELPPETLVSAAAREQEPPEPLAPQGAARAAPRLKIQRDGVTIATLPLAAGLVSTAVDGTGAARLQVQALDWAIHAGSMRGTGNFGSFVRLGWRIADAGIDAFGVLPPSEAVWRLLPPGERMESRPPMRFGRILIDKRFRRLAMLKARLR